ncbi:HEAT repeat domain-containing protein [Nocardia wallacei]|uniref:HEAT repeat domain-containing protein n=1 Tax=Nocardia wallacei TaxID=480035 RepID=UPI002457F521|nr:HEAT repeat domain-containing protein [Nocardia wallacei]
MSVIEESRSPDWEVRRDAVRGLGLLLPAIEPLNRLVALLDDDNIAVEQEAAEALVRHGGRDGLRSVFEVLGRRRDDPDADYIAYRLRELQIFESVPIMERAREIANSSAGELALDGIRQLEELIGPGQ